MTKPMQTQEKSSVSPSIPRTMRAAAIDRFGGPDVITLHELPVASLAPDDVLIAVHTAGVGSWDAEIRGGWWPYERAVQFPFTPGSDGSGMIVAKGSKVNRFKLGDAVYGFGWGNPKGGFYADYIALPAENVAPVPTGLDLEKAGGAAVIGLTALQGIEFLHLKKGERLLIHGASGGVGSAAVQFAKARGAQVIATASGEDGIQLARQSGADEVLDGKREDLLDAVRVHAVGGFDAIFATTGAKLNDLSQLLRSGGRLVHPNGVEPLPEKRDGIQITAYDAKNGRADFERLNAVIEKSGLKVPQTAYPLAEAGKAQDHAQNGHVVGKIVLRVRTQVS